MEAGGVARVRRALREWGRAEQAIREEEARRSGLYCLLDELYECPAAAMAPRAGGRAKGGKTDAGDTLKRIERERGRVRDEIANCNRVIERIEREQARVDDVIYGRLTHEMLTVLRLRYGQQMEWDRVSAATRLSKRGAQRLERAAIEELMELI